MTFVQSVYFILKLLEMAQQNIFHVAAGSRFAPADNRYNTHQLFMCGAADVQRLSVGQFHFLEIGFPIVTRSIFPFAGGCFSVCGCSVTCTTSACRVSFSTSGASSFGVASGWLSRLAGMPCEIISFMKFSSICGFPLFCFAISFQFDVIRYFCYQFFQVAAPYQHPAGRKERGTEHCFLSVTSSFCIFWYRV